MSVIAPAPLTLSLPPRNKFTNSPSSTPIVELTRGSSHSPRSLPRLNTSPYALKTQTPSPRPPLSPRTGLTPRSSRSPRTPRTPRTARSARDDDTSQQQHAEHIESEDEMQSQRSQSGRAEAATALEEGGAGSQAAGGKKVRGERLKDNARKRRHDNKVHPSSGQPTDLTPPSAANRSANDGQPNKSPFSSSTQTSSTLSSTSSASHNLSPAVPPLVGAVHMPPIPSSPPLDSLSDVSASASASASSTAPAQLASTAPSLTDTQNTGDTLSSLPNHTLSSFNTAAVPAFETSTNESMSSGSSSARIRPRLSIAIPPTPHHHHRSNDGLLASPNNAYSPLQLPTSTNTPQGTPQARSPQQLAPASTVSPHSATSAGSPNTRQPANSSPRPVPGLAAHSPHTMSTAAALRTARAQPLVTAVMSPYTLRFQSIDQRTGRPVMFSPASRSQSTALGGASLQRTTTGVMRESLEIMFLSHYFHKYNTSNRVSIVISTVIWALFVINDALKELATERNDFYPTVALRGVDCLVGLLVALALGTKWIYARHTAYHAIYDQFLIYVGMTTFGVSQILFGVWQHNTLDPTYSMFMILIPSIAPTFLHQRFLFTCAFSLLLVPMFIILTLATHSYSSTATNSSIASTFVGITLANVFFCLFAYRRERSQREDFLSARQLEAEERKSQALLNNMMPVSAVAKLRAGAEYIYNKHEDVTILFSHIADFDDYTARLPPNKLVAFLNNLFYKFDQLTDELQVYKVETIGDVFLVCSNCPVEYERDDHAAIMCVMALAMMEVVRELRAVDGDADEEPVRLKLGIHTGEVIAGVVGAKYPRFRLMGDTVNTASRMSTTTPTNSIQLSPATHLLISEVRASDGTPAFTTKDRGPTAIKGKGMINTHFLIAHNYEHSRQQHIVTAGNTHRFGGRRGRNGTTAHALSAREESQSVADPAQADGAAELAGVIRTRAQRIKGLNAMPSSSPETHADWAEEDVDEMLGSVSRSFRQSETASMANSPVHFHAESSIRPPSEDAEMSQQYRPDDEHDSGVEDSLRRSAEQATSSAAGIAPTSPSTADYIRTETGARRHSAAGLSSRAQPSVDSAMPVAVFQLSAPEVKPLSAAVSPRVAAIQRDDVPRLPISNGSQSPARRRLQLRSTTNFPGSPPTGTRPASSDVQQAEPHSAHSDTSTDSNHSASDASENEAESVTAGGHNAAGLLGGHSRAVTSDSAALDLSRGISAPDTNTVTAVSSAKASHHSTTSFAAPSLTDAAKKQTRWDSSVADRLADRMAVVLAAAPETHADTHTNGASASSSSIITIHPSATLKAHDTYQPLTPSPANQTISPAVKRDSGDQQKLLITATNDTVKMDRLFKLGPTQSIMRPKGRRPWDWLTQRFITEPDLELEFQRQWNQRSTPKSRFWVLFCVIAFVPLSIYETLINLSLLSHNTTLTTESWLVRVVGVLAGFAFAWCTYRPFYQRWMQQLTGAILWFEACLFIWMAIEFHDYDTSYGVGVMLIVLCIVHMFVGLRFLYALMYSSAILLFYLIASDLAATIPAVVVMVIAGNVIYAESNYWGEYLARQDFIRRLKRENEKVRTQQFLDNMLPPLVLNMIKQGNIVAQHHQAADVVFCDIVSFTSIASSIPAEDVVAVLNVMFSTYDALSTQYSVYKVETIGDCWMGCCGVVSHETNHTQNIVDFALSMIKSTRGFRVQTDQAKITAAAIENVDRLQSPQRPDMGRQTVTDRKSSTEDDSEQQGKARQGSKESANEPISILNHSVPTGRLTRSSMSFAMGGPASPAVGLLSSATTSEPASVGGDMPPTLQRMHSNASTNTVSQSGRESVKGHPLVVRIGIHSGPVIAGVVGRKCARYHLFGETVTVAEEMEQHGMAGKVVISELTRQSMVAGMSAEQLRGYELEVIEPLVRAEPSPVQATRLTRTITAAVKANNAAAASGMASPTSPTSPPLPRVLNRYIVRRSRPGQRSKPQSAAGSAAQTGSGMYSQVRSSMTSGGLASITHASADKTGAVRSSVVQRNRRIALDAVIV